MVTGASFVAYWPRINGLAERVPFALLGPSGFGAGQTLYPIPANALTVGTDQKEPHDGSGQAEAAGCSESFQEQSAPVIGSGVCEFSLRILRQTAVLGNDGADRASWSITPIARSELAGGMGQVQNLPLFLKCLAPIIGTRSSWAEGLPASLLPFI